MWNAGIVERSDNVVDVATNVNFDATRLQLRKHGALRRSNTVCPDFQFNADDSGRNHPMWTEHQNVRHALLEPAGIEPTRSALREFAPASGEGREHRWSY